MSEQWKDIPGYEGLYQVSTFGRVKSIKRNKIMTPKGSNHNRYYHIELYLYGKPKIFRINRLVAMTFIPNPNHLPQVNHINGDRLDNNVKNLEWCTPSYNSKHAYENELSIPPHMKKVICVETGEIYESVAAARRATGCTNVSNQCNGKVKNTRGFHFQFYGK